MTPQEFEQKMRRLYEEEGGDPEEFHGKADGLMCDLLRDLGYEEGIQIFKEAKKWYA